MWDERQGAVRNDSTPRFISEASGWWQGQGGWWWDRKWGGGAIFLTFSCSRMCRVSFRSHGFLGNREQF